MINSEYILNKIMTMESVNGQYPSKEEVSIAALTNRIRKFFDEMHGYRIMIIGYTDRYLGIYIKPYSFIMPTFNKKV